MIGILILCVFFVGLFAASFLIKQNRVKAAVQVILVIACLICGVLFAYRWHKHSSREYDEVLDQYRNIYFEGKVVSSFTKKGSCLLYVKIDSTNTDRHYSYSRGNAALRIEDGIATLPIGLIDKYNREDSMKVNADYVIVNKDSNSVIDFINGDDTLTVPLSFWPGKVDEVYFAEPFRVTDSL